MALEVERKFLVEELPELNEEQHHCVRIEQGYLAIEPDGTEVRLRNNDNYDFELTVKTTGDLVREEITASLHALDFRNLWRATEGRRVIKDRWRIPLDEENKAELDLFHGTLQGLAIVEVEFETVSESEDFTPPNWFGQEVTRHGFFKNKNLALLDKMPFTELVMKDGSVVLVPEIKTP